MNDRQSQDDGSDQASQPTQNPVRRKAAFGATMKAVLWSFFGVRKGRDYENDAAQLNPVHVLIAGVIGAAIFVAVLVTIVKLVVGH